MNTPRGDDPPAAAAAWHPRHGPPALPPPGCGGDGDAAALARRAAPAGRVDDASGLAELLAAGGDRAARLREEYPARAAGDDDREGADRFCQRAVSVPGERARAEWAGTRGGARLRGRGREAACAAT